MRAHSLPAPPSDIHAEQVRLAYHHLNAGLLANPVNAILLAIVLWNDIDHLLLVTWLACLLAISAARAFLLHAYRKASPEPATASSFWGRRFIAGTAITGLLWGAAVLLLFPEHNPTGQLLLSFLICGMTAGGLAILSPLPGAFPAFAIPQVLAFVVKMAWLEQPHFIPIGMMAVVYMGIMLGISRHSQHATAESLRLRFDNLQLVSKLEQEVKSRQRIENRLYETSERLTTLIEALPDAIFFKDGAGHWLTVNAAGRALFQLQNVPWQGKTDDELAEWRPEMATHLAAWKASDEHAWTAGNRIDITETVAVTDDRPRHFDVSKLPLFDDNGERHALVVIGRDVTERKEVENKLRLAANVFEHAREGLIITDAATHILEVNQTFIDITGYSREEIIGKTPRILSSGRHSREFYAEMWQCFQENDFWRGEIWNRRKNGELYIEQLTISAIRDDAGTITHYVGIFSDITQAKQQEQRLQFLAHFDALTGLPNRVLLGDRLQQAMAHAVREKHRLAVCYLDLDEFKPINDTLGHEAGDQMLVIVAERLSAALRGGDTVARLGGDEFILLLGGLKDADECEQALERILDAVSLPCTLHGRVVNVSTSIGVTLYPDDDADADTLLRHADLVMYLAKQAGRNRYVFFDPARDRMATSRQQAQSLVEAAFEKKEFRLHYQPKINMRSGQVIGAEALIRWHHPERGVLPPSQFLPFIENTDFDIILGNWILDEAVSQLEKWCQGGLTLPISINVNISAQQLQQDEFSHYLAVILALHPAVPPYLVELEVVESTALQDLSHISRVIQECRDIGVSFALDDFGTGYSSLTYLKHLPANTLKIDQSFVRDMLHDPEALTIVEAVIGLAHAFQRQVIAEGVESVEQGLKLLELGCELAQGYYIAHPMPAEALPQWIAAYTPEPGWRA